MKVVKPNAVYFDHDERTPYQAIELIGRTCYKSEDLIKPGTDVEFIKKLVGRKHWAMLEHAHLYYVSHESGGLACIEKLPSSMTKYVNLATYIAANGELKYAFTASFTAIYNMLESVHKLMQDDQAELRQKMGVSLDILHWTESLFMPNLVSRYPEIFESHPAASAKKVEDSVPLTPIPRKDYIEIVYDTARDTEQFNYVMHETLPHTVIFTVDRGVTHEMVRHRPSSFAQESTRYCNYQKGKYGSEITVVEPAWVEDPVKCAALYSIWEQGCMDAEKHYMQMLEVKAAPQDARSVLPTSVKNDIVVTAVENEWEHILDLRLYAKTGAPHPDMLRVMKIAGPQLCDHSEGRLCPEMP